jgi:hypothetical protein
MKLAQMRAWVIAEALMIQNTAVKANTWQNMIKAHFAPD